MKEFEEFNIDDDELNAWLKEGEQHKEKIDDLINNTPVIRTEELDDINPYVDEFINAPPCPPLSFREFANALRISVENVGKNLDGPEDDWFPVMELELDGKLMMVGIDPKFFDSDKLKQKLVEDLLVPVVERTGAKKVGIVTTAWMVTHKTDDEMLDDINQYKSLADHPNREEVVAIWVIDAERAEFHMNIIHREEGQLPKLTEWQDEVISDAWNDRFSTKIQEVMR